MCQGNSIDKTTSRSGKEGGGHGKTPAKSRFKIAYSTFFQILITNMT